MSFAPLDPALDLVRLEREVAERWRADDVFAESMRRREGAPEWVFSEGPPTANGRPGLHHLWARCFKDLFPRFQTMRGQYVARKAGWDCHGLPVELEVEKELGFSGKPDIEEFGIAAFNERCRESVHRYVEDWSALTARIGMWIDTADAYWTLSDEYIESVWWLIRQMWDAGLISEGFKVVPYCGRCGTALSSHEVAQGYHDVTEPSVYVRFPLVDDDADLLVWTTTPWTLVSNVAVAVAPETRYARVRAPNGGRDLVLAANRVQAVLGDNVEIVASLVGADLRARHYRRPFEILPLPDDALRIVLADFVTVDEGSGIVHLAPAFGEVDREVGASEGLPVLNPVGPDARFDAGVPQYAGQFVKDADPAIVDALDTAGLLVKMVDYTHAYPHCWRCGTPLIYWATPTWFARTSERKAELLRENETIGWHPEHIKHGRFGDWLENNVDWALSRDRFWGTPLPVWRCRDCRTDVCVGSRAELAHRAGRDLAGLDLHRPDVDDIVLDCPCGGRAWRVTPILDAWFDSGAMPSAQFHYPFEHHDLFARRFPADFICEAIDQTRGWFYSLLAVNTLAFDRTPYRNVVCLGHIVDRDGQKMSKSRGNVIDPWEILDSKGADALRWYFFSAGSPWTSRRVYPEGIDESTSRFLVTLWNTASFFVTYANLDRWEPGARPAEPSPHLLDRWVMSRLATTVRDVTEALEGFDALRGAQALERLVDDLSNWYLRNSRPRFWGSDGHAHATLHTCLTTLASLLAPFCPFVADELHHRLVGDESVHLSRWPDPVAGASDPDLEAEMEVARTVVSLGRAARNDARLGVRQPLRRAFVMVPDRDRLSEPVIGIVAEALNVKRIDAVTTLDGLLDYTVVPNFRRLGPRLGPQLPKLKEVLAATDGAAMQLALDAEGVVRVSLDGAVVELGPEDVSVRAQQHEELTLAQDGGVAVALDLVLDDDLRTEGRAREIVRGLNDLRKRLGFEIADRVRVQAVATGPARIALERHHDWIAHEVLAVRFDVADELPRGTGGDVSEQGSERGSDTIVLADGSEVRVGLERVPGSDAAS